MTTTVICVNYFTTDPMRGMFASLTAQDDPDWRLLVVDNTGSPAEAVTIAKIIAGEPRASLVRSPENVGYLNAIPVALAEADLASDDWVVLCNPDIVFDPTFMSTLRTYADAPVGMYAPTISGSSGRDQNPYLVYRPGRLKTLVRAVQFSHWTIGRVTTAMAVHINGKFGRRVSRTPVAPGQRIYAPHGSCMLFSPRYRAAGCSLSQPIFLFGEEITVAEQCRGTGLEVVYRPELRTVHAEHASTGVWRSRTVAAAQAESARYIMKLIWSGR